MFNIGMPELLVVLAIVMILFGAARLPEIGTALGRAIRGFKKGVHEPEDEPEKSEKKDE